MKTIMTGGVPPLVRDPIYGIWVMTVMWHLGGDDERAWVMSTAVHAVATSRRITEGVVR